MKIEKVKALFFAQYLEQKVFKYKACDWTEVLTARHLEIGINSGIPGQLLLRSVNQLTNEELVKCYHLHSGAIGYDYTQDWADVITCAKHWIAQDGINILLKYTCTSSYLLRIGLLLPFTYLNEENKPITLTPDEIIALGWAKIYSPK